MFPYLSTVYRFNFPIFYHQNTKIFFWILFISSRFYRVPIDFVDKFRESLSIYIYYLSQIQTKSQKQCFMTNNTLNNNKCCYYHSIVNICKFQL